jgi:Resolvase, N terminal domain
MGEPRKPGVVGYIRVCTDEFAGSEPDYNTQREAILAESQQRELPLLYFFLDQRPCPSQHTELAQSPGLGQALTALGEGRGSVLAVANPRRLPEDAAKLIRLGRQQGWELIPLHVAPRSLPSSKAPPRRRASAVHRRAASIDQRAHQGCSGHPKGTGRTSRPSAHGAGSGG